MSSSTYLTALAGLVALAALALYFVGISPEMKRKAERVALKTMGENKASYLVKDQISKIPETNQEQLDGVKQDLGELSAGAVRNPLGEAVGEGADQATSPLTGR